MLTPSNLASGRSHRWSILYRCFVLICTLSWRTKAIASYLSLCKLHFSGFPFIGFQAKIMGQRHIWEMVETSKDFRHRDTFWLNKSDPSFWWDELLLDQAFAKLWRHVLRGAGISTKDRYKNGILSVISKQISINLLLFPPTSTSATVSQLLVVGNLVDQSSPYPITDGTMGRTMRASPLPVVEVFYSQQRHFSCTTVSIVWLIAGRATTKGGQENLRKPRRRRMMLCL